MLYLNNNWCNNITLTSTACNNNIEALTVNLMPFYLPIEFTNIYITVLYILPSADKTLAKEYINNLCNDLANKKPDSLQIIMGDTNRCNLKLPNFTQYVSCNTRNDARLDEFYCNVKDAYRTIKEPPLKNSDHNMLYMQPLYRRSLARYKPTEKKIMQITDESLKALNASFDITDWDLFIGSADDIDDLVDTVTDYIKFNTEMILPTKIVKQYPNNKPWINTTLRKLIVDKHNAFKSGDDNYHKKQVDINKAIEVAKSEYKDKVERQFKTNKMKDAWKGLHLLTGQKEEEKKLTA